jgi:hypothetical protein
MANQVYEVTHEGLSAVISAKAATKVLRKAIESQGFDAKSITGSEMRNVLMGPVLKELTGILPKDGVERTLKGIIKTLKKQAKEVKEAAQAENIADQVVPEAPGINQVETNDEEVPVSANVLLIEEAETSSEHEISNLAESIQEGPFPTNADVESSHSSDSSVVAGARGITSESLAMLETPPPQTPRTYSQEDLNQFLMRFAQVEHIKIVAIVQSNGTILHSRGSGFDLAAISRLGSMGLKLLSRGRTIHSFYLSHQKGQLFLFPLADHTLIVVGNSEVNVGEIFSTLSTLEESI